MPIADLPYRIEALARKGQYAYLARVKPRPKISKDKGDSVEPPIEAPSDDDSTPVMQVPEVKPESAVSTPVRDIKVKPKKAAAVKIRVLRNVTLCDGPDIWAKLSPEEEPCVFFVRQRLFGQRSIIEEYLASSDVASHASIAGVALTGDQIVTQASFAEEEISALATAEYGRYLKSKTTVTSFEALQELYNKIHGIEAPKIPVPAVPEVPPEPVEDEIQIGQPAPEPEVVKPRKKPTKKPTLRDQFTSVQATPSRVIDVSSFMDTMQNQKGRILNRVKNAKRISECTSLGLFPVISDNLAGFTRAMNALGPRYDDYIVEFKKQYASSRA